MGAISHKVVTKCFPQEGGNQSSDTPRVIFDPTIGDEDLETPPPNDSFNLGVLRRFQHCTRWVVGRAEKTSTYINCTYIKFLSKPNLVGFPLFLSEYKALQKEQAMVDCIQSLLSKNTIERMGNVKSLWFYSRLYLVPKPHQRWRPVIDLSRLNTSTCRKVKNGNSTVHQDLPDSRGMGIINRPIRHLPSHPHPPKLKEIPMVLPQVTAVPVHIPSFQTSHSPRRYLQ